MISLSGLTFAEAVNFQDFYFPAVVTFRESTFAGPADFRNSKYEGKTSFQNVIFTRAPLFFATTLHEDTDWTGITWADTPADKEDGAKVYTDEHGGYSGLENHEVVKHSVGEYVKEQAHTNGIESFWSMLKWGYVGTYHQMSVKHLDRYVSEFAGRHNARPLDTIDQMEQMEQMEQIARALTGKTLKYQDLIA